MRPTCTPFSTLRGICLPSLPSPRHQPQCHFHIHPPALPADGLLLCLLRQTEDEDHLASGNIGKWKGGWKEWVVRVYGRARAGMGVVYVCVARGLERHPFAMAASAAAASSHRRRRHHRDVRRLQRPPFPEQNRRSDTSHEQRGHPGGRGEGGGAVLHAEVRGALRLAHDVGNDAHVPEGHSHLPLTLVLIGVQNEVHKRKAVHMHIWKNRGKCGG